MIFKLPLNIPKTERPPLKPSGQTGQMTLEMILLTVVIVAVGMSATKYIQDNKILASLVGQPWAIVRGMIEDGVWVKQGPSKATHPNLVVRHLSPEGDKL